MGWKIRISDEAKKDYRRLDGSLRKQVLAGIIKVSKAPLPSPNAVSYTHLLCKLNVLLHQSINTVQDTINIIVIRVVYKNTLHLITLRKSVCIVVNTITAYAVSYTHL